ncbi:MAG: immunoglobulin domain-containing protein [Clostridia bacterium]|nr:immunoglobulin domain-containing protein [Clostridia bacterium]
MDGWCVWNNYAIDGVVIGQTLKLPDDYKLKLGEEFVTSLADDQTGTIVEHKTHNYTTAKNDDHHHWTVCACGDTTEKVEHTFTYTPVTGKEVHIVGCSGCTYTGPEEIPHEFTNDECDCTAKAVARVDDTLYANFANALAAWTDGTTLTLLDHVTYDSDINLGGGTRTFDGGDYTLDLAGKHLLNEGTLTIQNAKITSNADGACAVENEGMMVIKESTITNSEGTAISNRGSLTVENAELNAKSACLSTDVDTAALTNCTLNCQETEIEYTKGKLTIVGDCDGWEVRNTRDVMVAIGTDIFLPEGYYMFEALDFEAPEQLVTSMVRFGTIRKHTDEDHTPANKDNEDGITHDESCTICGIGATNVPHTTPNAEGKCVCGAKIVAMVDDTCYSDFAKAVAAWTGGTTLTLLDDVSYDSDINLGAGTRTFAGGEHTLTLASEANWIDNDGTLTIASGTIISEGSYAIQNSGTLNIEGGMVSATAVGGVAVDNMDGTLNITGGTVSAPGLGGYAIVNHSSMTLDGGTIEGYSCIENSGTAELKRGTVTASDGYALNNFGTATLSGADLATEGNNPAVFCSSGKTTISGGTLAGNGEVVIWRVDGTLTITTTGCNGWKVISSAETATIGEDITLPDGYYVFDDDGKFIPNLEAGVIGTITEHTHELLLIDNKDGKSHDLGCVCGAVSNQEIPHFAPNAEGKCVCGAKIVAMVDDTCYSDINVAINDWENNAGTLTLLDNVSYAYPIHLMGGSYIFEGGNFELDMDGYELNVNGGATLDYKSGGLNSMLSVYGTLNATGGTITQFIFNFGVVNLSGARVVTTAIAGSYAIENYGDLTISNGSLECVDDADAAEIFNAGGTVTIENTAVPEGWRIKHTTEDTLVLDDYITLPDGFYVFMDKKIVTELAAGEIGTITCHPDHTYICTADDDTDTITYACSCGVGTRTAKLAVPASPLVYDGEAHPATVEASDSKNVPVVTYILNGQAVDEPINAGSYTATMTWGEASVSADFTITPASLTAVALEGSRAYDATAEWVAPLEMSGVMNDDDVRGVVKFTLPGADVGEYTEATVKAAPELTGKDAGNYTLMPEEVSFAKATITRAAADKWNVSMASPQNVLVGSGLNAVALPTAGTGIDGETVQITNVTFYTDAAMQTPATDADISSLAVGESMTLYYVADAKNYESATGSLMLKAVDHLHEWHYAADAESSTIVATCGGTIGTCPTGTVTFKLVPPAEAVYGSAVSERSATCHVVPAAGTGTEPAFTYEALPGNAMLDSNGNPENAGEYKVTMALGGVSVSGTMAVAPAQIGRPAGYDASGVYNGQAHKPQVNYPLMTAGKDYTLTCPEDMVNAGRKTITVTGIGNYTGTVALDYEITKAILTAVTEPVDQTLTVYCADADAAISRLPAQVSYTAEDGSTVLVDVVWNCPDYDATPKAINTFTWTAVPAQLASCELAEGVPAAGTITVTGADAGRPDGKPPVIDAPDVDQEVTVYEGERGTMTVTATDAAGYQWYINRYDGRGYVPISGATSSTYITSAVTCDNNGFTYYCVVSNENGDSQSPFFTLKVPEKMDIPQTGDNSNITLWFALMFLSIAGLAIIMKANRRDSITR